VARPAGRVRAHPVGGTAIAAGAAAVTFLLAPVTGRDLAAQVARAQFWARHGAAVLDLGWYGGHSPFGYSLLTPAPMAWLGAGTDGPRRLGAIAAVLAAVAFAALLRRTGARRPLAGGLLGVAGIFGNLVSGRVTFTVGLAFGLAALFALAGGRPGAAGILAGGRSLRCGAAGSAAVLASAASPVAGLFTGLAGTALMLTATRRRADLVPGLVVAAGAGLPLVVTGLLFGTHGPMNVIPADSLRAITVSTLVAVVADRLVVRVGAVLSAFGVLAAGLIDTPVGLNAGRLSATFALGVLAAYGSVPHRWPPPVKALPLVLVALWQHPVAVDEVRRAGDPMSDPAYFAPLTAELGRRAPVGRVEIPATGAYWEAAYVPGSVPLARGWLRQADIARHPVFSDGTLSSANYERWLRDNGVSYVALAHAPTAWPGRAEARLIRAGQPYLSRVWRSADWTLYAVQGSPSVVSGATLIGSTDAGLTVDAAAPGEVLLRVRWSGWLDVTGPGGCVAPGPGGWTTLRVTAPGRFVARGALRPRRHCRVSRPR
jgi:hypothetical protein